MKYSVILFLLLVFAFFFFSRASQPETPKFIYNEIIPPDNPVSHRIDKFFTHRYKVGAFNGAVLFSAHDTIYYKKAFGYADRKKRIPLTVNSKFQLASVSKIFTAFSIMLLEKEGRISFQDSVRKFFPDFPYENITVHQLLVHRSGLPNYMYMADEFWKDKRNSTLDNCDMIDLFIAYEPLRYNHPGVRYNYNNTNYALLASIVEKVTEEKFSDFLQRRIFSPVGMINTSLYDKDEKFINDEEVVGYINWRRRADNTYLNGVVGDKGIYSTVEDLNKFSRAIFENFFFSEKEMQKAYQLYNDELYDNDNYGYGWRINMLPDSTKIVYHTGWWKGFRSYFIRSLADEKTIVVLSNNSRTGKISTKKLMDLFGIRYE